MIEAQKIRDRKMREIKSNGNKIHKIIRVKDIIRDLERHGPAGLVHVIVLSDIIKKSIAIWNADGTLNRIVGDEKEYPIHIEYHPYSESIGHWTLRHAKDPDNTDIDLNSCLFSVIASQIGQKPSQLRKLTILRLKSDLQRLADRVDEILLSKKDDGDVTLMIGGACYYGTSDNDAKAVLDASQNAPCYMPYQHSCIGHPRGHVSKSGNSSGDGSYDSVERYSSGTWKTAFLTRSAQDQVTHLALRTPQAQNLMKKLNEGTLSEKCEVRLAELRSNGPIKLQGKRYENGVEKTGPTDINKVILILRHHKKEYRNPYANVFIHTCYPILI